MFACYSLLCIWLSSSSIEVLRHDSPHTRAHSPHPGIVWLLPGGTPPPHDPLDNDGAVVIAPACCQKGPFTPETRAAPAPVGVRDGLSAATRAIWAGRAHRCETVIIGKRAESLCDSSNGKEMLKQGADQNSPRIRRGKRRKRIGSLSERETEKEAGLTAAAHMRDRTEAPPSQSLSLKRATCSGAGCN